MVVGTISGAVVGLIISGHLTNQIMLTIICALVAAVLALAAGHRTLGRNLSISLPPSVVLWNVVIASLIGGLAGHELSVELIPNPSDHDRCAQSRNPSDMMAHGRASSLFHASQQ